MEPLTPASIQSALRRHGLRPSRALGQNFLADPNTARRIVRFADVRPGDAVIEIGPGLGSLTLALAEAGATVIAVELDRHVIAALHDHVRDAAVTIVEGDALTMDWHALLDEHGLERAALVANLPYNVATPVVIRVLETAPRIDDVLVMVQREVGERYAARPRTKAYGSVTVKIAFHAAAEVVGTVPPAVFIPRPNVESALVRLRRHRELPVAVRDEDWMFGLVRAGFATRRKMLRQSLKPVLGNDAEAIIRSAGVAPTARAEELDLSAWAALSDASMPSS